MDKTLENKLKEAPTVFDVWGRMMKRGATERKMKIKRRRKRKVEGEMVKKLE